MTGRTYTYIHARNPIRLHRHLEKGQGEDKLQLRGVYYYVYRLYYVLACM